MFDMVFPSESILSHPMAQRPPIISIEFEELRKVDGDSISDPRAFRLEEVNFFDFRVAKSRKRLTECDLKFFPKITSSTSVRTPFPI